MEQHLSWLLECEDERGLDSRWSWARERMREYSLRPAKRLRPASLAAGYSLASEEEQAPREVWRFAAGVELLHTLLLVHDDVADRALLRRGGPALHQALGSDRSGEDLAIVVGDYLFAGAVEVMLSTELPGTRAAVSHLLAVCRYTAAGQYLDLELSRTPLAQMPLARAVRMAWLKTARYSFVAPLQCGVMLAGRARERVERVGRPLGLAYQRRDDLIGLFGDPRVSGKPVGMDLIEGKRTYPVIATYTRADPVSRREFDTLWAAP